MRSAIRLLCGALVALALMLFTGAAVTKAQMPPPCNGGTLTITNNTPFPIHLCLWSFPAIPCIDIPPGLTLQREGLPNPLLILGVRAASGINYPFAWNPAPPPPLRLQSVALLPTGNCFNVQYDPATCTITILPAGPPPCTNP